MLPNKKFQSNETQEVVTIAGDTGVFYNLSNGANIKKDIFFQKYSEMLDTNSFFQQQSAAGLAGLADQLKQVDSSKMQDIGGNIPPAVRYIQESVSEQVSAPAEYKEMLLRRFEQEQSHKDLSQYKVYENEDDAAADFERKQKQNQQPQREVRSPRQQIENPYPTQEIINENRVENIPSAVIQQPQMSYNDPEEEAWRFFKSFKRIYPIKLSVDFDERIAEPMFLKMMANNFESDIIKYYTKQIMDRIYNDPGFLENKIYEKLKSIVYDEPQKKERKPKQIQVVKKPAPKKRVIPSVPKEERERFGPGVD